jgi:uncharacterized protein YdeI (YjbR/CyaY-like superfamily)
MGGRTLISLPKAHREAAGLKGGDAVTVTLVLDAGPRQVDVPPQLRAALEAAGLADRFAELTYSKRKEYARQVTEAKTDATRDRRIEKVLADLS